MKKNSIQCPILISEGKVESLPDFINLLFEYAVFFRWAFFKNRPRGNLLLLRSILAVGVLSVLYYTFFGDFRLVLEGIEIDPVMAFGGAVVIGYWNMTSVFHKKSAACQSMYWDILMAFGERQTEKVKLLSSTLAIQLLTLDLWAHRSFRFTFTEAVSEACRFTYDLPEDQRPAGIPKSEELFIAKANKGQLQSKEIRAILDHYHAHLMHPELFAAQNR